MKKYPYTIIIDTREKLPLEFPAGILTARHKLDTGDYSIEGLENHICIERKSVDDFVNTVIHNKERWDDEVRRMGFMDYRAIVI